MTVVRVIHHSCSSFNNNCNVRPAESFHELTSGYLHFHEGAPRANWGSACSAGHSVAVQLINIVGQAACLDCTACHIALKLRCIIYGRRHASVPAVGQCVSH